MHASALAGLPEVRTEGCEAFDEFEIRRLLDLELQALGVAPEGATLTLSCEEESAVRLELTDPPSGKRLERTLFELDPAKPGGERLIAIAASQLVVALDWLPDAPAEAPPAPSQRATEPKKERATATAPAQGLTDRPGAPEAPVRAGVLSGARLRDLSTALVTGRAGLWASAQLSPLWALNTSLGVESGRASRVAGAVGLLGAELGVGVAATLFSASRARIDTGVNVAATYFRLQGEPETGAAAGRTTDSYGAQVELYLAPIFELGPLSLGLPASAGLSAPAPEGLVQGEPSVNVQGAWLGLSLAVGYRLAP